MSNQVKCPICGRFVSKGLHDKYERLVAERDALLKSNNLLEEEIKRLRESNTTLSSINKSLNRDMQRLKSRGFIERLFNRDL